MRYTYIAIEGLIGAGKTTLAKRLAQEWSGRLVLEEFDDNPFLPKFYEDPARYGFSVELSFLAQRYHQLKRTTEQDLFSACTVADYSIGKSVVFANVTLQSDEYVLFRDLYTIMYSDLPSPELIVYLYMDLDRVQARIRSRGRSYEQSIHNEYLVQLQERYLDHLQKLKDSRVLVVDLQGHDLLNEALVYEKLLKEVDREVPLGYRVVTL
ncbi:MAG: deoxynucleoside kinase [Flavobacteriales bacterium]|nr:deoxynucleoside kinase [Flavobacteriales bacterium]MBP6642940.1 deoxynucleoside kinase [Flavobacteriales bacterium]MBP7154843.1 deoxynucleoside kinase [Flavobacteriales bacterium]HQV75801.1 deoxynucleoside kinase [Flavobacteriales bacterium]